MDSFIEIGFLSESKSLNFVFATLIVSPVVSSTFKIVNGDAITLSSIIIPVSITPSLPIVISNGSAFSCPFGASISVIIYVSKGKEPSSEFKSVALVTVPYLSDVRVFTTFPVVFDVTVNFAPCNGVYGWFLLSSS